MGYTVTVSKDCYITPALPINQPSSPKANVSNIRISTAAFLGNRQNRTAKKNMPRRPPKSKPREVKLPIFNVGEYVLVVHNKEVYYRGVIKFSSPSSDEYTYTVKRYSIYLNYTE